MEETTNTTTKTNAVNIVTIKSLTKVYKNGEEANAIELANCEEHNFDVIVQKGLYVVGDQAIYVQPDYCLPLPNIEEGVPNSCAQQLFCSFTVPLGDAKKTKLGKHGRIRAIKFNFNVEGSSDPIYSMGVMLPISEVINNMKVTKFPEDLDAFLEVTKYEEPESAYSGMSKGALPLGMYSTDETNINNVREIHFPIKLTGSLKIDGSSITVYYKNEEELGVCSRNLEKKLEQKFVIGYKDENGNAVRKHYDVTNNVRGWLNETTNEFFKEVPTTYIEILGEADDTFVKLGAPVLEKLKAYCATNNMQLALRGELHGSGLKGSGNKNNPHANLKQNIKFYGVDDYSTGITKKMPLDFFYALCKELELDYCDVVFSKEFTSFDELKETCNTYFKTNVIEGIVLRNDTCSFSVKFMNLEYDSKK